MREADEEAQAQAADEGTQPADAQADRDRRARGVIPRYYFDGVAIVERYQNGITMKTEKVAISLKLPAPVRDAVRGIAAASHRSLNAEVTVAIERHIHDAGRK